MIFLSFLVMDVFAFFFSVMALAYAIRMNQLVGKGKELWPWKLTILLVFISLVNSATSLLSMSNKFCFDVGGKLLYCFNSFPVNYLGYVTISETAQLLTSIVVFAICFYSYKEYSRLMSKFRE